MLRTFVTLINKVIVTIMSDKDVSLPMPRHIFQKYSYKFTHKLW